MRLALQETDRLPFGFWRHFPNQDRCPRRLAHLSLELQQKLDLDFIKFTPYPVQAINYHDREAGPPLAEMRNRTRKCLLGGLGHTTTLVHGTRQAVAAQVRDAWEQVGRRGLILGPGCVASLETPETNLLQLRSSVRDSAAPSLTTRH